MKGHLIRFMVIWLLVAHVYAIFNERVIYKNSKIPLNLAQDLASLSNLDSGHYEILNVNRENTTRQYLCHVPPVDMTRDDRKLNHIENPEELISRAVSLVNSAFSTQVCFIQPNLNNGYWTLGYCYGDKVIQYHEDFEHLKKTGQHKAAMPSFVFTLGTFPDSPTKRNKARIENSLAGKPFEANPSDFSIKEMPMRAYSRDTQKVLLHTLWDGTTCDLTGEPREVRVLYRCDPRNITEIWDVTEYNTCHYEMVISVGALCEIDEFKVAHSDAEVALIECDTIGPSVDLETDLSPQEKVEIAQRYKESDGPIPSKITPTDLECEPIGDGMFICLHGNIQIQALLSVRSELSEEFVVKCFESLQIKSESTGILGEWPVYDFLGELLMVARAKRDEPGKPFKVEIIGRDAILNRDPVTQVQDDFEDDHKEDITNSYEDLLLIKEIEEKLHEVDSDTLLLFLDILAQLGLSSEKSEWDLLEDLKLDGTDEEENTRTYASNTEERAQINKEQSSFEEATDSPHEVEDAGKLNHEHDEL